MGAALAALGALVGIAVFAFFRSKENEEIPVKALGATLVLPAFAFFRGKENEELPVKALGATLVLPAFAFTAIPLFAFFGSSANDELRISILEALVGIVAFAFFRSRENPSLRIKAMGACLGFAVLAFSGCSKSESKAAACERALARLERISAAKGQTAGSGARELVREMCLTSKYAEYDPVLRCAMDSKTDDEAAACIERGIKEVLKPSDGSADGSADGSGLNPLLDKTR